MFIGCPFTHTHTHTNHITDFQTYISDSLGNYNINASHGARHDDDGDEDDDDVATLCN